ncbi:hypothetical protein TIFTF001_050888 [Ficus carica]|uniref:Uncharacterized protein n=1 Tax=Ficus carica TaxID=3494 RepID=A0AA88CGX7_FICCA|nr:hypothetical protein TIFTF001_050885 [Ficus carica]GMN18977.1 hypothetical protein TIFTF001_050886 [Ficus carica]GMN18983.1 hypothetical protein TIFTF001_050887 [Ficus carica]GMN18988.1 hypothetical protein TIFTF001_050888 [Ficus carica]
MGLQGGKVEGTELKKGKNQWADPLFIDVLHNLGCSNDPIGSNSECPRRVDKLQLHRHRSPNRLMPRVRGLVSGDTRVG